MRALLLAMLALPSLARADSSLGAPGAGHGGLTGTIHAIPPGTRGVPPELPRFPSLGVISTDALDVAPRDFHEGFPGVTGRTEWFAIDYRGEFTVAHAGRYEFTLNSDDGSRLFIDGRQVVDNDGEHPPVEKAGAVTLETGVHRIEVRYYQGPQFQIALQLFVRPPGATARRIFSLADYTSQLHTAHLPRR